MSVNLVNPPYVTFKDVDGDPLESGYIYIGNPGLNAEASPKTAYFDEAKTIVATQPIRTIGGFPVYLGSPAKLYVEGDYSIVVKDKRLQLVQSALTSVVIPDADGINISFDTLADLNAATVPDGVGHVMAAGLVFVQDNAGTAQTSNGGTKNWSPVRAYATPLHWGAAGDGVTDDTSAVQAWLNFIMAENAHTELVGPKPVFSGAGRQYAISSGLTIPGGCDGAILRDFSLIAIGNGWSSSDFMVTNNATYADFYSIGLNCNDKCSGWDDAAGSGRVRHYSQQIYRMVDYGYRKSGGGGELRYIGGQITQFLTSDPEFATQSNFTAVGMFIEESDCKIHDTNIRWCKTCYESNGGQQYIYNCHFVQGTAGAYARTNAQLIKWDPASGTGSGELFVIGTYLDNGYCDFFDDKVNLIDCTVLLDSNDVDVDDFFRLYAYSGAGECQATARIRFSQWDDTANLFNWLSPDGGTTTWPDDYSHIVARFLSVLSSGSHQEKVIDLFNTMETASSNANGNSHVFNSINIRSLLGFRDVNTSGSTVRHGSQGDNAYISADDDLIADVQYLRMPNSNTPASAAASGVQGQITWDTNYIYVCVAANTWKRVAISTW